MSQGGAIVVTGASSGIGLACTQALAQRGYDVFAGVRQDADFNRLGTLSGVTPLRLDVTDQPAVELAVASVRERCVTLRAVISNAGIAVAGPLEYLPLDDLRRQLEVNVIGALAITQAFLPLLRTTSGRIIFIGSISGRLAVPYIGPYGASKAALRALAGALRVELAPAHVGVVLIEPSSVRTPIWQKGLDGEEQLRRRIGAAGVQIYGRVIDAMVAETRRQDKDGMPVEPVVAAIVRAIEARRPPAEVLVGIRARLGSVVAALPPRLRDRMLVRSLRLPVHG